MKEYIITIFGMLAVVAIFTIPKEQVVLMYDKPITVRLEEKTEEPVPEGDMPHEKDFGPVGQVAAAGIAGIAALNVAGSMYSAYHKRKYKSSYEFN